ncbi:MAG: hypothetical protein CVV49_16835 [Spirochaetae bacterium HGW-Spirochaetae-5]|nr:MAG: hypothetical protein CVV49_16835 [Spirochaetae bacterium HGW-Spirochaetae-5]
MKSIVKKYKFKRAGRESACSLSFSALLLFFTGIMIFTFTPVKADSFDVKPPCCGTSEFRGSYSLTPVGVSLSESCPCCGGICRCNFSEGIPVNDTVLNISPRSSYYGDQLYAVSHHEYSVIEYNTSAEWRASLLMDYGEPVPLYLLNSSLLFYH